MPIGSREPKSIEAVVRVGIENSLLDLRTVHPCKVSKVNNDGTVDVDLMIHTVFIEGDSSPLPSITGLPILYQGSDTYSITFPISVGDEGLAFFAERDISKYLEGGIEGPPNALRRHSLSDGVFMPTPISSPRRLTVSANVLKLENSGTSIEIENGKVKINGDLEISGNVDSVGEVTASSGTPASVSLSTHLTTGITPGGGNSLPPLAGS